MQYRIVFDTKRKILKAVEVGRHRDIVQYSDKRVKKLNGGKAPKFPKGLPPSGSVWGVTSWRDAKNVKVYLIPKPITEIGPKHGRITGRDSRGNPIYGGYYSIEESTRDKDEITWDTLLRVTNTDTYEKISEKYKETGLDTLSKRPILVDIATGKIIGPESEHEQNPKAPKEIYKDNVKFLENISEDQGLVPNSKITEILDKLTKNGTVRYGRIYVKSYKPLTVERTGTFCGFPIYTMKFHGKYEGEPMATTELRLIRINSPKNGIHYMPAYYYNVHMVNKENGLILDDKKPLKMFPEVVKRHAIYVEVAAEKLEEKGFVDKASHAEMKNGKYRAK